LYTSIATFIGNVLRDRYGVSKDVNLAPPSAPEHGDLTTSVALEVSRNVGKSPREIAEVIVQAMKGTEDIERMEVAGAGHINIFLTPKGLLRRFSLTRSACTPKATRRSDPPIIVDYCGPNIAKPLGVHHILAHVIGQAIINIYRHLGRNVIGWSYPGDWGTQFGKLAVAFRRWGEGKEVSACSVEELLKLYVRFHEEAEGDPALEDEAREAFRKLEQGDTQMRAFWNDVVQVSRRSIERLYERLHIHIDVETGESFYEDKMEPILNEGMGKRVFTEGEKGALIVEFEEETGLPPYMLKKGDGSTLYATRDLAMIRYRIDTYRPQAMYYVVDRAQSLHFQQLFATCRKLQWDLPILEHTVFGRMSFKDKKMSTRTGSALKLEDVVDEAVRRADAVIEEHREDIQTDDRQSLAEMMGTGALAYGILSQNRKKDIVFDWNRVLSFEGNSAPYLQYTHARARSVIRKAAMDGTAVPESVMELTEKERRLINLLLQFARVLEEACETRLPHILTNYLYALCQEFNAFYNVEPILRAAEPQRSLRLALTSLTASVLKTGAELLTLRVPDRM
jgi:arginyl-tRNA synthetase